MAFAGVIVGSGGGGGKTSTAMNFTGFRDGAMVVAGLFVVAGVVSAIGISNRLCDVGRIPAHASASARDRVTSPPALPVSD